MLIIACINHQEEEDCVWTPDCGALRNGSTAGSIDMALPGFPGYATGFSPSPLACQYDIFLHTNERGSPFVLVVRGSSAGAARPWGLLCSPAA